MTYNILLTYVWLCGLLRVAFLKATCPYKECQCSGSNIICKDKGLQKMPSLISGTTSGFTALTLLGTQITTVPSGSLPSNLKEIYVADNPITLFGDAAFNGSNTTLTKLYISDARLTRIPNAFHYLRHLTQLHIKRVPIFDWSVDMKNIGSSLEILDLENVNLTTSPTWLQYFCCLIDLSIVGSSLRSLPDNAMDMMANSLLSLSLNNNSLTEVPKALSKLKSLRMLHLTNNKITSTQWFPASSHLVFIALNINQIHNATQLSISLRPLAGSLASLDLEQNELTAFPELSFLTHMDTIGFMLNKIADATTGSLPPELHYLDLQNNSLPTIPRLMSSLQSITDVYLQSNKITVIRGIDFPPKATTVKLGTNLLSELTDMSFPENSVVKYLFLNDNPISKISSSAFKNLPQLLELSLQSTKLTRLPLSLSSLVKLKYFDITYTTGLICTCQEKSLESLVLLIGPDKVIGNCGLVSVYYFFANLNQGCPT